MYKSIILPEAKQDIKDSAKWYNSKQKGLGKRFTNHVRKKVHYIRENPEHIAVRFGETRTAMVDTFPYMIHFTIDDDNKTVIVSAVFATKDNPEKWNKRK
jgi:plasmid stabilization system protein ParE